MSGVSVVARQPFSEHIRELRSRVFVCVAAILLGSLVGYMLHQKIFAVLRKPLGEQLYYTSPVGGLNAVIKISLMFGLMLSVPIIIYQICAYLSPAFQNKLHHRAFWIILSSTFLAICGVSLGYFISLPTALDFLTNIDNQDIKPFIIVNEYLNFAFSYLVSFALLFQLPLILLFINRIKPQRPRKLMKLQKYVIAASFIIAAFLTPTPDPINQTLMALPMIVLYQVSILLVWWVNRKSAKKTAKAKAAAFQSTMPGPEHPPSRPSPAPAPAPTPIPPPQLAPKPVVLPHLMPRPVPKPNLIMDIVAPPKRSSPPASADTLGSFTA